MKNQGKLILAVSYIAFISLGLPDAVLGVAWPGISSDMAQSLGSLGYVLIATGSGYFLSSTNAPRLAGALGLGNLLMLSTLLVALGVSGYALAPSWPLFLVASPLIGAGSGAIDASLNTFAAREFTVRHVNWLHAFYGVGATLGPMIMVSAISRTSSWRVGYGWIGAALFALSLVFAFTRHFWRPHHESTDHRDAGPPETGLRVLRQPVVQLQVLLFFCYTGLEVSVGQWAFTLQTKLRGLSVELAGTGNILYWGGLTAGRIALGYVAERIGPDRLLRLATVGALAGILLFLLAPSIASLAGLALAGTCLAPIYPTLMSRTPARVGIPMAAQSVGFQVTAAMIGALLVPSTAGLFSDFFGLHGITWVIGATAVLVLLIHETLLEKSRTSKIH